jgi:nucleotide-binding universal stress UspA family protein
MNAQQDGLRIIVATDGSEAAGVGVELVRGIDWPDGSSVTVVEAVESGVGLFGGPWPTLALNQVERIEEAIRTEAGRVVAEAARRLARPGLAVDSAVLQGRPATAITERAREMGADLIVVGGRGHGTIETVVLGSVSAEIVDRASVPVLVARSVRLDGVVFAWDGSDGAATAADLLERWPIFQGADVRVVSVADVEVPWWSGFPEPSGLATLPLLTGAVEETRRHHAALADSMAARLRDHGLAAEPEPREGDAATELIRAAVTAHAGLVVMGTHGRTGLGRIVLGSVAHNVVRHAPCNVLVVHDPTRA